MQLTIFNGSPRGKKSNTKILMEHFADGFTNNNGHTAAAAYLHKTGEREKHVELFKKAEHVILAFPLYTDAMPGIVMHFIEALEPLCGRKDNPAMGFVIQSGFPEPIHSRYVASYMEKLARRLGSTYTGTVIRGGVEGIQVKPPWMNKKLFHSFRRLGVEYATSGHFDEEIIRKLAPRERLSAGAKLFLRIGSLLGMTEMYWNMKLKQNNSFENRFARPFKDS